jgi:hypothetical protein
MPIEGSASAQACVLHPAPLRSTTAHGDSVKTVMKINQGQNRQNIASTWLSSISAQ